VKIDDLAGKRAARWIRESTDRQGDRYGPDAQREQQDRAIDRYGLVDTGIAWQVHHSGRTIAGTAQWTDMMAGAGRDYDVLLVGYVSRFARDLRTAVNARHELHLAGAALLFCDERVLSSDDDAWETWAREAVEAEAYSRRLGRRIREGYEAKWRRHSDPGGTAPLGFTRVNGLLEVDQDTIARAVAIFTTYAEGRTSLVELELETGVDQSALREILRNPIYNGWVARLGERAPAPWRSDPPIDDELWARVQLVRERRNLGGGGARPIHDHLLAKLLWCICGDRLKADGSRRYRHTRPCVATTHSTIPVARLEDPISAQVAGLALEPDMIEGLARLAGQNVAPPTGELRRRQLERELADRAAAHARREITTEAYLADHVRVTAEIDAIATRPLESPLADVDAIVGHVADVRRAWGLADAQARTRLVRALYERVTVNDGAIVEVQLTPEAWRHGIALALPEMVAMARPAGVGRAKATLTIRIPIAGRTELERALREVA
jgi:DNA invertase Pin-like site-specific DNA recombinase